MTSLTAQKCGWSEFVSFIVFDFAIGCIYPDCFGGANGEFQSKRVSQVKHSSKFKSVIVCYQPLKTLLNVCLFKKNKRWDEKRGSCGFGPMPWFSQFSCWIGAFCIGWNNNKFSRVPKIHVIIHARCSKYILQKEKVTTPNARWVGPLPAVWEREGWYDGMEQACCIIGKNIQYDTGRHSA